MKTVISSTVSVHLILLLGLIPLLLSCGSTTDIITESAMGTDTGESLEGLKSIDSENDDFDPVEFHLPHIDAGVGCLTCHAHHGGLNKDFPDTCLVCHDDIVGPHLAHSPFDVVSCLDCHGSPGGPPPESTDCLTCHAPLGSHPYIYDCVDCHSIY